MHGSFGRYWPYIAIMYTCCGYMELFLADWGGAKIERSLYFSLDIEKCVWESFMCFHGWLACCLCCDCLVNRKWRNETIFEGKSLKSFGWSVLEIDKAFENKKEWVCSYIKKQIICEMPQSGCFVLNTDGCVKGRDKLACAGSFYEMMMASGYGFSWPT